jgi:hypothetical protein
MEKKLTEIQAFKAMVKFLEIYYNTTCSDDVGSLLSSMQLFPEGETWDPAIWREWVDSINYVLADSDKNETRS